MSRAAEPVFSVVIPCRNEVATLADCLDALLAQDYPAAKFEVILVDGGSTDGSCSLARRRGVRVLQDGGTGPSGARNLGILAARAPTVAFTDADCVPRHDWLARLEEVFAEDPGLAGVGGGMRMGSASRIGLFEDLDARVRYRGLITSNAAYRRNVLLEVGGFAEDLLCAEDYDLAWRVMDAGHRVVHDPRPVVTHNPPELGSLVAYLRKQAWYARHDVPTHLRALRRARADAGARGSASALDGLHTAAHDAAWALALGAGALAASPAVAGASVAGAGAVAALKAWRMARKAGEGAGVVPTLAAFGTAKTFARGVGTLAGLADLARGSRRRLVTPPAPVARAPSSRRGPPPSRWREARPA